MPVANEIDSVDLSNDTVGWKRLSRACRQRPDGDRYTASFGQLANRLFAVKGLARLHWRYPFAFASVEALEVPAAPAPRTTRYAREDILMTTSYHRRRLCTIVILAATLGPLAVTQVTAGANPDFRIVLHAKPSSFEPCNGYLPVDCVANPPTVDVTATPIAVFVLLFNYTSASGIQTGFTWAGWSRTFSLWDCALACDFAPCETGPLGAQFSILDGDFIQGCVNAPALKVIGRMHFVPGVPGCISQFIPDQPNGIHLRDCTGGVDLITDASSPRLGKICSNTGGVNACDGVVPVESTTWGQIKSTY